jgi:hypothetical protein
MKTKKTLLAIPLLLLMMLTTMEVSLDPDPVFASGYEAVYHTFSVDPTSHDEYGLTYPVTYEFSIPNGASNLKAYKRFTLEENWVQIVTKTSNDFFNGIEAARFDYDENKVYVSIAFTSYSDFIYLYFTDSDGNELITEFSGITEYYDNRRVAVVITIDDVGQPPPWGVEPQTIEEASIVFADAEVWWTAGVNTGEQDGYPPYETLQESIDRGYFEVAAHSRWHPHPPYDDYDFEIGGCKEDLITNLNLPYSKGDTEYVWCWIEPYGESDDTVQYTLGQYKYLVSRNVEAYGDPTYYEEWNDDFGLFNRAKTTIWMDEASLDELNNAFDYVYSEGGIYHAWGHIILGWEPGDSAYEHVQYVKGKEDVWYVGFGALYAYAYTRMHMQSMTVAITPTSVEMYVGESQPFSSFVSGGTEPYSYQWYMNDSPVSGATDSTWTFTPPSAGNYKIYLLVTDSLNAKAQSNTVKDVYVYSQLSVSISPFTVNMKVGESKTFISTVSGGIPPFSYQWYLNSSPVSGATGSTWTFTPTSTGTYKIYIRVADSYTATAQSNTATARVETPMIVAINPLDVNMYFGQSQMFSSSVTGGTPPYSYQWYWNDTAVPSATNSNWLFTPRSTGNYKIYLSVTDSLNIQAQSNVVTNVSVYSVHLLLTVDQNQATYTRGQPLTFTVNVFNQLNPPLETTLTLTITGLNNYYEFDFQPISVSAGTVGEYSFAWDVPDVEGTYVVEVGLIPSILTAYDSVWLEIA